MGKAQREREKTLSERLTAMKACSEAVEWVGNRNLTEAWRECERADWMLWLCNCMAGEHGWPKHEEIVLAACDCALTVKHSQAAIEMAQRWAHGKASIADVRHAANIAYAAASDAAHAAYSAAYVAYATANAVYTSAIATTDCAADAARHGAHIKMCHLIRKRLKPGRMVAKECVRG